MKGYCLLGVLQHVGNVAEFFMYLSLKFQVPAIFVPFIVFVRFVDQLDLRLEAPPHHTSSLFVLKKNHRQQIIIIARVN